MNKKIIIATVLVVVILGLTAEFLIIEKSRIGQNNGEQISPQSNNGNSPTAEEQKAEAKKSVQALCNDILDGDEVRKQQCQTSGLIQKASENSNEGICDLISEAKDKETCLNQYYLRTALNGHDPKPEMCEKIVNNEGQKNGCLETAFYYKANLDRDNAKTYCEKIATPSLKDDCLSRFIKK